MCRREDADGVRVVAARASNVPRSEVLLLKEVYDARSLARSALANTRSQTHRGRRRFSSRKNPRGRARPGRRPIPPSAPSASRSSRYDVSFRTRVRRAVTGLRSRRASSAASPGSSRAGTPRSPRSRTWPPPCWGPPGTAPGTSRRAAAAPCAAATRARTRPGRRSRASTRGPDDARVKASRRVPRLRRGGGGRRGGRYRSTPGASAPPRMFS